jgi:cell wall-associated NlpC family hydrolase
MRLIRGACIAALAIGVAACATHQAAPQPATPFASAKPSAGGAARLVQSATAMLGQPYRYGGAAPGGFDCSGLVDYAAKNAGAVVPRTAQEQLRIGIAVGRDAVRAGDLVFMHLSAKELHVGIAVEHSLFVHAPSAGGRVRIDSLNDPPYARGFLTARRIVVLP